MQFSHRTTSYFCLDAEGNKLFTFLLQDRNDGKHLEYAIDLAISLHSIGGADELLSEICLRNVTEEKRGKLIDCLFDKILSYPEIELYLFRNEIVELNLEEKYGLLNGNNFDDYTPFSEVNNSLYFGVLVDLFHKLKRKEKLTEVDPIHFFELIPNNFKLQNLYVEFRCEGEMFYYFNINDDHGPVDVYCMEVRNNLVFCFLRRTP